MASDRWLPLESNPDVLNKYIEKLGVTNGKFLDIVSFDNDYLSYITDKIVAIIILYPVKEGLTNPKDKFDVDMKNIYFCDQIIHNACGTLAVIHAILNNVNDINLDIESFVLDKNSPIESFYRHTLCMTPKERGKFLLDFEPIKNFHTDSALEGQTLTPPLDVELDLHFVTIVGKNNHVYELGFVGHKFTGMQFMGRDIWDKVLMENVEPINLIAWEQKTMHKSVFSEKFRVYLSRPLAQLRRILSFIDGSKDYPIVRSPLEEDDQFFQQAIRVCKEKMENDPTELRFNVMALAQTH